MKREKRAHRPKYESFKDFVAFNFKTVQINEEVKTKHITFLFSKKYLVTIHSGVSQIRELKEKIEKRDFEVRHITDTDYLLYLTLEELVESFFPVLEKINVLAESLERGVFERTDQKVLTKIFKLKRHVFEFHKILIAEREVLLSLHKGTSGIREKTVMYFRDLHDHLLQIIDEEEIVREVLSTALESYASVLSYKLNDVVKVLTVISTVLLPMTVITGIYGMNISFPEARVPGIYYVILGILATIGLVSFFYFKRKKWV